MEANYDTLYWLLSALIQSFAAILSIVGFFVVYSIQQQQKLILDAENEWRTFLIARAYATHVATVASYQNYKAPQLEKELIREAKKENKDSLEYEKIQILINQQKEIIDRSTTSINQLKRNAIYLLSTIGFSIVFWITCIGSTTYLVPSGLATYVVIISIILSTGLLLFVIYLIKNAIN